MHSERGRLAAFCARTERIPRNPPSLNRGDYHEAEATCSFVCPKTEEAFHRHLLCSRRAAPASRIRRYQVAHSPMIRPPLVLLTSPYAQQTSLPFCLGVYDLYNYKADCS